MKTVAALLVAIALLGGADPACAKTFRWASDADVASLDPYSGLETFQVSFLANIYEPLVRRDPELQLEPALATSWTQEGPLVWRFHLRRGVKFQDGSPFTADDVRFSFHRATADGSQIALALSAIREVRRIDDETVELVTTMPDPTLPQEIAGWGMMSKAWCEQNAVGEARPPGDDDSDFAATHANGTGPFAIATRDPGSETDLVPYPGWWDQPRHNLDRAVFRRIADDAARVAALEAGEVDMLYSVPPQSTDALALSPHVRIVHGPELRTIFLGFDQSRPSLAGSNIKGRNPFNDRRVREAFARAIDEDAIAAKVMRGLATPAALLVGPGVAGFAPALNRRLPYDPAAAERLLAEAGYSHGFALTMDCPNDRYVNDEAICQAVAAMLGKIGVRVQLHAQTRAAFFGQLLDLDVGSSFYLLGWTASTHDAYDTLLNLAATQSRAAHAGTFNVGGYSNPDLDLLLGQSQAEMNPEKRLILLRRALVLVRDDVAYIPLHQQDLVWAARDDVELVQRPDDSFALRYVRMK
jgi:peptide/nickel transport system substrate-binding protein